MSEAKQQTKDVKQQNKAKANAKVEEAKVELVDWCSAYDRMLKGEKFIFDGWSKGIKEIHYVSVERGQTKPMLYNETNNSKRPFIPSIEEVIKKQWKLKTGKGE